MQMPKDGGVYGRIAPLSGISLAYGLDTGAGVIDASYQGPIMVLIRNHTDQDYFARKGDKIVQIIIITRICLCAIEEDDGSDGEENDEITDRGTKGFGSNGV